MLYVLGTDMSQPKLRKVAIDYAIFSQAYGRDVEFHEAYPESTYLDLERGEILWVYKEDEDAAIEVGIPPEENRAMRERIETAPDHYLEIPGLHHGDHHKILQEFLDSDWTDDEEARSKARNAYIGSIGGWKKSVDDEGVVHAFYDFRDHKTKQMAEEFLREYGIQPQWK